MSLALLFAGQGAQKVGMGKSLYDGSPAARAIYVEADQILGWSLTTISFEGPEEVITQTKYCQPALYVHGLATLAALIEQKGMPAVKMALGLSLGEVTALAAAGVFDFTTGLKIVAIRGELMQQACEKSSGGMAAVIGEDRSKIEELCREFDIQAANFNAPGQIIISGEKSKVGALVVAAKEYGLKRVIPLNVAGAYHSRLMEPARNEFARYLAEIPFKPPQFPVFTNTTGKAVLDPEHIRAALAKQVVSSVLWEDCMRSAVAAGATEFWECGPGAVLAGLAKRTDKTWLVKSYAELADITP